MCKHTEENPGKIRISLWNRNPRLKIPVLTSGEGLGLPSQNNFSYYILQGNLIIAIMGFCFWLTMILQWNTVLLVTHVESEQGGGGCVSWWRAITAVALMRILPERHTNQPTSADRAGQFREGWNSVQGSWNGPKCWRSSSGEKISSLKSKSTCFGPTKSSAMAGDTTWQERGVDTATNHRKTASRTIRLYCIGEDIFIVEEWGT